MLNSKRHTRKSQKYKTYASFTNEFNFEPYLLNDIQKYPQSVFAKLRC